MDHHAVTGTRDRSLIMDNLSYLFPELSPETIWEIEHHHAQDAVDAEPGVPEAGVGVVHFAFGPRGVTVSAGLLSTASRTRANRESNGTVQVAYIERLVQIPDRPRHQRLGLPGVPVTTHHEDWRFHAKVADALQQVETLFPAVAHPWNDHVEQNEIERSP